MLPMEPQNAIVCGMVMGYLSTPRKDQDLYQTCLDVKGL